MSDTLPPSNSDRIRTINQRVDDVWRHLRQWAEQEGDYDKAGRDALKAIGEAKRELDALKSTVVNEMRAVKRAQSQWTGAKHQQVDPEQA